MADSEAILVDAPSSGVRRITLNRPEKRNALDNVLRTLLFEALHEHDADPEVRVSIIRGAGSSFSSGYDLASDLNADRPYFSADGDGVWSRHVTEGWTSLWDLAKPVIAQVHGHAVAGGSELMAACDLAYVAEDAKIAYPVVRLISPPDMQFHPWLVGMRNAMELMLTGDSIGGIEAAEIGLAARVLEIATRVARIPSDLQQLNKRSVHRAMEIMGIRTALRAGSELQALATHQPSVKAVIDNALEAMKGAVDRKDG